MKKTSLLALMLAVGLPAIASAAPITGYEATIADQKTTVETLAEPGQVIGPYGSSDSAGRIRYSEQPALWWVTDNTNEVEDLVQPNEVSSADVVIESPLMSKVVAKVSKKKKHSIRRAHKHVGCVS